MGAWLEFLAVLALIAVPFLAIGFSLGYATGGRRSNMLGAILSGLALMAVGALGMASIGLVTYPVGALLLSFGLGRRWKGSHYSPT